MKKITFGIIVLIVVLLVTVTALYFSFSERMLLQSRDSELMSKSQVHSGILSSRADDSLDSAPSPEPSPKILSDPDADATLSGFSSIGETYTLHARQYQQGEAQVEDTPSLGWDGDMTLLVKSASLLPYEENGEYGDNDPRGIWPGYADSFQEPGVLRVEMQLKNLDAHNRTGVQYQFNASMFFLSAYDDLVPQNQENMNYVNITQRYTAMESYFDKNSGTKDYWSFELQPGETMDFVLEFLIDREYLEQQSPFLAVSLSREIKAGILLDDIVEDSQ